MSLEYLARPLARRALLASTLFLFTAGVARAQKAKAPAPPPPPPRLRIKNGQMVRVALERRRHEPASGIRPEKGAWTVIAAIDLTGASAELVDLTPYAARSRWVVQGKGDKLVLDARRFLPSHVYQLDVRKEKRLIGTTFVYLYPPPSATGRAERVEFKDEEERKKDDSPLSSVPKGDL
jgi:hypothetical protein